MTQYLLSVHSGDADFDRPLEEMQPLFEATEAFNQRIIADGSWVFGGGLKKAETAKTVDGRGDESVVTDGPYAETKEAIGGYFIIEAADLDEAAEIAKGCPVFDHGGLVEVREINEN